MVFIMKVMSGISLKTEMSLKLASLLVWCLLYLLQEVNQVKILL